MEIHELYRAVTVKIIARLSCTESCSHAQARFLAITWLTDQRPSPA